MPQPNESEQPANPVEESAPETPETPEFDGYESAEARTAAIHASRREGSRLAAERAELAQQVADLERRLPSEHAADRRALDELQDLGLPADTFKRAVREEFEALSAPRSATDTAVASVRRSNPDFKRFEGQFTDWLAENPHVSTQYAKTVAAAPDSAELALEGVFAQFARTQSAAAGRKSKPAELSPDAALPTTQSGSAGARRAAQPKMTREDRIALIREARDTGDPVPIMRAILGNQPIHRDIERMKGN